MNRKMPLYTIPHHVNSFVTEWILIYLYNFLFSVFYLANIFTKLLLLTHFLSLSCEKAMLYCFSYHPLSCWVFVWFLFHLKKKSLSFSFSIPASIWQDFSRSPPPEPAPHDPALLVYKQQLQHLESNRGGAFDLNPEHQSQDSCNSQM